MMIGYYDASNNEGTYLESSNTDTTASFTISVYDDSFIYLYWYGSSGKEPMISGVSSSEIFYNYTPGFQRNALLVSTISSVTLKVGTPN